MMVIVYSTALAIIVRRARRQGFWGRRLHWRVPLRCTHLLVARRAAELPPTCSSETLTFLCHRTTDDGWRSWWTVCQCMEEHNWRLTSLSCLHNCDGSARRGAAARDRVALAAARRRKERTYPEFVAGEVGDVGPTKQWPSSGIWQKHASEENPPSLGDVRNKLGA